MKIKSKLLLSLLVLLLIFLPACKNTGDINDENVNDENVIGNYNEAIESANLEDYKTLIVEDYNDLDTKKLNNYKIDVVFNPKDKSYTAKQTVTYINNENVDLDFVYFHLYPNAFKDKETTPFLFDDFDSAYANGFSPGYMNINVLKVDGKNKGEKATFGETNTILKVPLNKPLKPGKSAKIYMEYDVLMPPAQDRFGYGDKTFNLGNWYPIVAVFDETGWNLDPYYRIGDPFYSDTSNYEVTIKAPKEYIIASSGNIISEKVKGKNKTWEIEAKLMRDFAWVTSEHFIVEFKEIEGTLVKNYFLEEKFNNQYASDTAYNSIRAFNKVFGKYPYGQYSVVATEFPSGMEYPGIVFINKNYYNNGDPKFLRIVIAHETGHQWWYSIVGNDEIDEAWLDESLTTYSEVVYHDEVFGEKAGQQYYDNRIKSHYENKVDALDGNEKIVRSLKEFKDWDDYGALVYTKGAMFINAIKEKYGKTVLYDIFSEYYKQYRFKIATTDDFIKICEKVTDDDFTELANKWLYNK